MRSPRFLPRSDPSLQAMVVGLVVAAFVVVALAPGRLSSPIRRVANYAADGPDPIWDTIVDGLALREGGRLLPDDATYYIYYPRSDAQLAHDLQGGTLLFFTPARPVRNPRKAEWVLSYDAPRLLPPGLRAERRYPLARDIYLVKVQPR